MTRGRNAVVVKMREVPLVTNIDKPMKGAVIERKMEAFERSHGR